MSTRKRVWGARILLVILLFAALGGAGYGLWLLPFSNHVWPWGRLHHLLSLLGVLVVWGMAVCAGIVLAYFLIGTPIWIIYALWRIAHDTSYEDWHEWLVAKW